MLSKVGDAMHTCMSLQSFGPFGELPAQGLIVFLICNPPQEVDAVQLMEYLHANTIPLFARPRVVDLQ